MPSKPPRLPGALIVLPFSHIRASDYLARECRLPEGPDVTCVQAVRAAPLQKLKLRYGKSIHEDLHNTLKAEDDIERKLVLDTTVLEPLAGKVK